MMAASGSVVLVTYLRNDEALQILGVYADEEAARRAIARAEAHPAFVGQRSLFWLDEYRLGRDEFPGVPKP